MKKLNILLILFSLNVVPQAPTIEWQQCYGLLADNFFWDIKPTTDGGYIVSGEVFQLVTIQDFLLYKISANGAIEWQKKIGGDGNDYFPVINQTLDGGYIVAGISDSNISGDKTDNSHGYYDIWVLKLDSLGNIIWQKTIGGDRNDSPLSIEQTTDGGFIIGGTSTSNASGDKSENKIGNEDYWVVKINSIGIIEWENTIGGIAYDSGGWTKQTLDGGYLVAGTSESPLSGDKTENNIGDKDYWIVKLDSNGVVVWDNTIGGTGYDFLWNLETTSTGYVIAGMSVSGISGDKTEDAIATSTANCDIWVLKLDFDGTILWQNTIGGTLADFPKSISKTNDGGFIIGGFSNSNSSFDKTENCRGENDLWIIKVNANGEVQWDKTLGGSNNEVRTAVRQSYDGGYIVGGYSDSPVSGDKTVSCNAITYWIVKLSPEQLTSKDFSANSIKIYPNPTTKTINIDLSKTYSNININVTNVLGQVVQNEKFNAVSTISFDLIGEKGVYFVTMINENNEKLSFKVLKE